MIQIVQKAWAITADQIGNSIQVVTGPITISGILNLIITWIVYLAGVLAFLFLIYSGILYITSGGNPDQAKKAQQGLISAIIGIIVIALSFVILKAAANLARGVISQ